LFSETHPDVDVLSETPVNAVACLSNFQMSCDVTYNVMIRKCDDAIQYFLPHTGMFSAYCFGTLA